MTEPYKPSDAHLGGQSISPSYLKQWQTCPLSWYWRYLHPTDDGKGIGLIREFTGRPLLLGSLIHEGLAAYLLSGWGDGSYDVVQAWDAIDKCSQGRAHEWQEADSKTDDTAKARAILENYNSFYGPNGKFPDYPTVRILADASGAPYVERTFTIPLSLGFTLNVKPDAVCEAYGFVTALEHKSCSASSFASLFTRLSMDGQTMAEMAGIQHCIDQHPSGVYVNALVTNRAARSKLPSFERQLIHYDTDMTGWFLEQCHITLANIIQAVQEWQIAVDSGHSPTEAAKANFPARGFFTGACSQFSGCEFRNICSAPGMEEQSLRNYLPRQRVDTTEEP